MTIREVLERRRRILAAVDLGVLLLLMFGLQLSVSLSAPWVRYAFVALFLAAIPLNSYWLRCPRCRRSIGLFREKPRRVLAPFGPGEMCPYCGVSLEEPWHSRP